MDGREGGNNAIRNVNWEDPKTLCVVKKMQEPPCLQLSTAVNRKSRVKNLNSVSTLANNVMFDD